MYKQKYIKYKKKYLNLKNIFGGSKNVIDEFDKAENSNDISVIIDKISQIKDTLNEQDVKKIIDLATTTKNRLGYEQWNKHIRSKFYMLLEDIKKNFEVNPNTLYALPQQENEVNNDKYIEKKMDEDDNKTNTDEESFGLKINKIVQNIIKNNIM